MDQDRRCVLSDPGALLHVLGLLSTASASGLRPDIHWSTG